MVSDSSTRTVVVHNEQNANNANLISISVTEIYLATTSFTSLVFGKRKRENDTVVKIWRGAFISRSAEQHFIESLHQELDKWQRLAPHPNIASFIGLVSGCSRLPALVMPYYQMGNVNEYLASHPKTNVLQILRCVAAALRHMHGQTPPLAHGKVKGSNILIANDGTPCLTDIGISNMPWPAEMNMTGGTLNESRWMAPELMDPEPSAQGEVDGFYATPMSDIYSFGMTILELYTGKVPFAHRRFIAGVIHDVVSGIRPPRPISCNMSDSVWGLVQFCWNHNPSERPNIKLISSLLDVLWHMQNFSSNPF